MALVLAILVINTDAVSEMIGTTVEELMNVAAVLPTVDEEDQHSSAGETETNTGSGTTTSSEQRGEQGAGGVAAAATDQRTTTCGTTANLKRPRPATKSNDGPKSQRSKVRVSLLYSDKYTDILSDAMEHIHRDRDRLLSSLLLCCGFLRQTPSFFTVVEPKRASRGHMERFHCPAYLDLLEYVLPAHGEEGRTAVAPRSKDFHDVLDSYGLTEDCHLPEDPEGRARLWRYCQYTAGASLHGAHLLLTDRADVAINWGGGRHHAHHDRAGGFCFVSDVVLAIQHLLSKNKLAEKKRVLYLDIDIHHADGVQSAFYDTDEVLTVSFHRRAPGFFPPSSGDASEKGRSGTDGVGFALNLPLPKQCNDDEMIGIFTLALDKLLVAYEPDYVVLCVGADGVKGDPIVGIEGWGLSPEGLAECVRLTAKRCDGHSGTKGYGSTKLLLLGAGGYHPTNAARTFLLSTAAACEGARPGMLWNELPKDVPQHEFFGRYGPEFQLISPDFGAGKFGDRNETSRAANTGNDDERTKVFDAAKKNIDVCSLFVHSKRESLASVSFNSTADYERKDAEDDWEIGSMKKKAAHGGGKRRKRNRKKDKRSVAAPSNGTTSALTSALGTGEAEEESGEQPL